MLKPETWPVFSAWYKEQQVVKDYADRIDGEGRAELADMLKVMRRISVPERGIAFAENAEFGACYQADTCVLSEACQFYHQCQEAEGRR